MYNTPTLWARWGCNSNWDLNILLHLPKSNSSVELFIIMCISCEVQVIMNMISLENEKNT